MRLWIFALAALLPLAASGKYPSPPTQGVTDAMLGQAAEGEWLSYGNDYGEQRFSTLTQINDGNVRQLGLAWFADLDTTRGQEATPLMHAGVLYFSTAWSMVKAYDAKTGMLKWSYDPKVPRETLARACCDAVNRGVALYGDKLYVGTLDGRLLALEQSSGKEVWSKVVVPNQDDYTITGAPRAAKGKVFIGSGGAEYRARGYIAAFDAQSGKELWRFYTVPGNPADGFENEAMAKAARTWSGEWWKLGGGGTVWDAITYDPATNLVLFGTGNAEPWNPAAAGREGDSLYTSSIVAVHADTGKYAWHFQETPEDRWDYDSNAQITLADLKIGGRRRHVALHAPKNGYFYVLDAATGAFLSAGSIVPQNWTTGIDARTGRPSIHPQARYERTGQPFKAEPGALGAHSWQPMSFSPITGLVYIPGNFFIEAYGAAKDWRPSRMGWQTGQDGMLTATPAGKGSLLPPMAGALIAWDPVVQRQVWRVDYPAPPNGGTLATAGNLVFQGAIDGRFMAFSADKGTPLWSFPAQAGIGAGPMSYSLDGEQYIAVLAGFGGPSAEKSRLLVFKIGARGALPPVAAAPQRLLDPPPFSGTSKQVTLGADLYGRYCWGCHGIAAASPFTNTPDLRYSGMLGSADAVRTIVIDGALRHSGMVSFSSVLKPDEVEAIRQYLIKRANEDRHLAD